VSGAQLPAVAGQPWEGAVPVGGRADPLARRRRLNAGQRVQLAIVLGDALGAATACAVAAFAEPWLPADASLWARDRFAVAALLATVAVLVLSGASARRRVAPRVADDLAGLLAALGVTAVVLLALHSVGPFARWTPPVETALWLGTAALAVPAARAAALRVAGRSRSNVTRVVIVGAGAVADDLARRLARSALVEVVGVVDDPAPDGGRAGGRPTPLRLLGRVEDLPLLCATQGVDRLVVAFSGRHPGRSAEVLQRVRGAVDIDVVVRYYELANWESRLSDVTGLSLLCVGHAAGPVAAAAKRCLDVAVAGLGLALLAPVFAAVAVAVRLETPGPVFFRQARVGRGHATFRIVKFRTMAHRPPRERTVGWSRDAAREVGADGAHPVPVAGPRGAAPEPRTPLNTAPDPALVTRVGRLLRRTGVDELPQLVNVLRGEMSLVGPRPFVADECEGLDGAVERRFDVRPGITGMWQVCGQHEVTFEELCRLDVQYATSWSLRGDLRILARTPGRLVRGSAPGR
jgi:exopolysaccharide biosynthesis polyprenyl glycosylphosphotransferase